MLTANPHRGRMKDEGQHPFELCSPRIPTGAGRSIREGQHQPWERTEARMGVRLLGRAMLGRLVVAATKHDFVNFVGAGINQLTQMGFVPFRDYLAW